MYISSAYDDEPRIVQEKKEKVRWVVLLGFVAALLSLFLIAGNNSNRFHGSASTSQRNSNYNAPVKPKDAVKIVNSNVDFTLQRDHYNALPYFENSYNSIAHYEHLRGYDAIVEPYAPIKLHIYSSDEASKKKTSKWVVRVCKETDGSACAMSTLQVNSDSTVTASTVTIGCSPYDRFGLILYEYDVSTNDLLSTSTGRALCSYVRRELHSLHPNDYNAYMDAAYVLDSVSTQEGKQIYGDSYIDSSYTARLHYFNSAHQEGDHYHEGNGFFSMHVKLSNYYEAQLQVVDPSVSLPYWDFTIEAKENLNNIGAVTFQPDSFGTMYAPPSGDYFTYNEPLESTAIKDGRWAGLKAVKAEDFPEYSGHGNAYGYLRSPWNLNPSPYITRATITFDSVKLPTCSSHYTSLEYTDFNLWMYDSAFDPHGPTHTLFGGYYGCEALEPFLDGGYLESRTVFEAYCAFAMPKLLYRFGTIAMPESCEVDSEDVRKSTCSFECTNKEMLWVVVDVYLGILGMNTSTAPDDAQAVWTKYYCGDDEDPVGAGSRLFGGDHIESASGADPSFYPIHPTLERLWHGKLMLGGFEDETWYTDAENDFVCFFAMCYHYDDDAMDYYDDCCAGHRADDRMYDGIAASKAQYLGPTNAEILAATDPRSSAYSVPYIYDNFEWEHCRDVTNGDINSLFHGNLATNTAGSPNSAEATIAAAVERKARVAKKEAAMRKRREAYMNTNKQLATSFMQLKKKQLKAQ